MFLARGVPVVEWGAADCPCLRAFTSVCRFFTSFCNCFSCFCMVVHSDLVIEKSSSVSVIATSSVVVISTSSAVLPNIPTFYIMAIMPTTIAMINNKLISPREDFSLYSSFMMV